MHSLLQLAREVPKPWALGGVGVVAGGLLSGCAAAVVATQVIAGAQLAGVAGATVAVASGATPTRSENLPSTHVSIEPAGVARTLIACREALAKHELTEIRYEINQRETLLIGRSTDPITMGETVTFHLRQRSAEKTVLVIEAQRARRNLDPVTLSKSVRQSTSVRTGGPAPKAG